MQLRKRLQKQQKSKKQTAYSGRMTEHGLLQSGAAETVALQQFLIWKGDISYETKTCDGIMCRMHDFYGRK